MAIANAMTSQLPRLRVLLIEDQPAIRELVGLHLRLEHLIVTEASDGQSALELTRTTPFNLIVIAIDIPSVDGITLCRAIRHEETNANTPIMMLTARHDESNIVVGLDSGADDFLVKPFSMRELVARTRALVRWQTPAAAKPGQVRSVVIRLRNLEIDTARRRVCVGDRETYLTPNEFELLTVLASNPGVTFSRQALLSRVWRPGTFVSERSVDALVKRLRKKIEVRPGRPELVITVRELGYRSAHPV